MRGKHAHFDASFPAAAVSRLVFGTFVISWKSLSVCLVAGVKV